MISNGFFKDNDSDWYNLKNALRFYVTTYSRGRDEENGFMVRAVYHDPINNEIIYLDISGYFSNKMEAECFLYNFMKNN